MCSSGCALLWPTRGKWQSALAAGCLQEWGRAIKEGAGKDAAPWRWAQSWAPALLPAANHAQHAAGSTFSLPYYFKFTLHLLTYTPQTQLYFTLLSWDMFDLFRQSGEAYLVARALGARSASCQILIQVYASAVFYCLSTKKQHSHVSFTKKNRRTRSHDAFVFQNMTHVWVTKAHFYSALANITSHYWLIFFTWYGSIVKSLHFVGGNKFLYFISLTIQFLSGTIWDQAHEQTWYKDQFWFLVVFK